MRFKEFINDSSWVVKSLSELSVGKENLVRGPFGGSLKKEDFTQEGYKVYEQKNAIYADDSLGTYYIDDDKFSKLKRFEVVDGDLIVSCSGTIGKVFRIKYDSPKGIINQALLKIRLTSGNKEFFEHYFKSHNIQKKIIVSQGGAIKNIVGMETLRNIKFIMPRYSEQAVISRFFTKLDQRIEKQQQLIDKYKELKKGYLQKLFPKKGKSLPELRFNCINRSELLQSINLNDVMYVPNNVIVTKPSLENIVRVRLNLNGLSRIKHDSTLDLYATKYYYRYKGQFIYGKQNIFNGCFAIVSEEFDNSYSSGDVPSLNIKEDFDSNFVYFYFSRKTFYKTLERYANGSGSKRLHEADLLKVNCSFPRLQEQIIIANFFANISQCIDENMCLLSLYKIQKKHYLNMMLI